MNTDHFNLIFGAVVGVIAAIPMVVVVYSATRRAKR